MADRPMLPSLGAIGAAFLASLCCIGPVIFVTIGVGAGLAAAFEPLRPLFTAVTIICLAIAFYVVYGRKTTISAEGVSAGSESCVVAGPSRREKVLLWSATIVAAIILTFPQWSLFVL
jgi:mercuric ion transport protein